MTDTPPTVARVDCNHPGCGNQLTIDARHARNFEGREWTCRNHDTEVTC
jgi:hypothetical protein